MLATGHSLQVTWPIGKATEYLQSLAVLVVNAGQMLRLFRVAVLHSLRISPQASFKIVPEVVHLDMNGRDVT